MHVEKFIADSKMTVLKAIGKYLKPHYSHAIDDVAQETFIRAFRFFERHPDREIENTGGWIYTIARNESFRMNKKLDREDERVKLLKENFEIRSRSLPNEDPVEELLGLVELLPVEFRKTMQMSTQGIPQEQIAKTLNIKTGTVKSRIFRGKKRLKQLYIQKYGVIV